MILKKAQNRVSAVGLSLIFGVALAACNSGLNDQESDSSLASEEFESTMNIFNGQLYCQSSDGSRAVRITIFHDENVFNRLHENTSREAKVSMVLEREVPGRSRYQSVLLSEVAFKISRPGDTGMFVYELTEPTVREGFEFQGRFSAQAINMTAQFKDEEDEVHNLFCNQYELDI